MRKLIFLFLLLLAVSVGEVRSQGSVQYIIYDEAVTVANDSLYSAWRPIKNYGTVGLFFEIGDSISFNAFTIEYRGGSLTAKTVSVLSGADTLSSLGSPNPVSGGAILRGYTANIIPGASEYRIKAIRRTYSTAVTSSLKVAEITGGY